MNRIILLFIGLFLIESKLSDVASQYREVIYLPMKKDHKYGDDICYYREIDEKLDYAIYYVKPCEKGKYCENEIRGHPYGFCRDIPTNVTDFPSYGDACSTNGECQNDLICDSTCKKECTEKKKDNRLDILFQHDLNDFDCEEYDYKTLNEKYCVWRDYSFQENYPQRYQGIYKETKGKFPGLPKECGIINYKDYTDYDTISIPNSNPVAYKSFKRYLEESREWCSIGEVEDGVFVTDKRFCKSGFTLNFYINGELSEPIVKYDDSGRDIYHSTQKSKMCVTPIQIDYNNSLVGCVITYKIKDGSEQKYNADKFDITCSNTDTNYNKESVIKSQIYTEFIEEFNKASDEDKKNCYKIPQGEEGNCENIKLLKLYYFYKNINEYLFYKDRKDLEKVLHFKIQQSYPRYYELSSCLNLNYLFFLLILILL